ncbi:MAG: CBS domain-containing protein [Rhodospirillales bacterium]|nr:CBS domain-containing protein [Rhodospirillales bacterium]
MNTNNYTKVADVMTPDVKTVERMATVKEAIDIMRTEGVSSLAVERRDETDEFGLLVVSDIASKVIGPDKAIDRTNVYEVMAKPVLSLPPDMNIKFAVRLLVRFTLSRALVVNLERKPIGIVTLRDMVLRHSEDWNEG